MRTNTLVCYSGCRVGDELSEFSRGGAAAETVEISIVLQGDEAVLIDMTERTL